MRPSWSAGSTDAFGRRRNFGTPKGPTSQWTSTRDLLDPQNAEESEAGRPRLKARPYASTQAPGRGAEPPRLQDRQGEQDRESQDAYRDHATDRVHSGCLVVTRMGIRCCRNRRDPVALSGGMAGRIMR